MATLDELNVVLGADTSGLERGLAKGASSIDGFANNAAKAGASVQGMGLAAERAANGGIAAADKAAGRFLDSSGRMHEANGRFVKSATLAAEAAGNFGGTLGGAAGSMGLFSSANAALAASFQKADAQRDVLDKGFGRLGETVKSTGENLSKYVTVPLVALGGGAVKVAADFESGFNRVEAATQAVGPELEALKNKAQDIALDPRLKFSAADAAGALEGLAKNGLSTTQILEGAADAAVNLATATGGNLANASDITTDIMQNFGKKASELAGVVDQVTGATIASKFGIEDYQGALAQAGAVAGQLGVNFTDFNTALSVTSSGFSSGSDAGTSFKTFLQRLNPASNEAAEAMQKLGLRFFDAQGKMLPLRDIAGQLQKAFKGLSDEQRNGLGTQIFGADSIRTALLLAKEGTEGFDKMAASIGKVNAAAQGAILSKGFSGALEALKSAAEGAGIAIAEKSGLLDFGTNLLKSASDAISGLSNLDPALLKVGVTIGAFAAAIGPLLIGAGSLVTAITAIAAASSAVLIPLAAVTVGVAVLAGGLIATATSGTDAVKSFRDQKAAVEGLEKSVSPLLTRYDELKAKTTLTKDEQAELRTIVQKVGEQIPTAITAFDQYGKALDISTDAGRRFVEQQRAILLIKNKDALKEQREAYRDLSARIEGARNALSKFDEQGRLVKAYFDEGGGGFVPLTAAEITALQTKLQDLLLQRKGVGGLIDELKGIQPVVKQTTAAAADLNNELKKPASGGLTEDQIKALEKLREELRQNQLRYQALGESYDVVGNKQRILLSGIESLIGVGFRPAGATVQSFVGQLLELPKAVDQIETPLTQFLDKINKAGEKQAQKDFNPIKGVVFPELPETLPGIDTSAVQASYEKALADQAAFRARYGEGVNLTVALNQQFGALLANGINNAAIALAEAGGNVINGTVSLGEGLSQAFKGVLGAFGGFLVDFGKLLVTQATLTLTASTLASNPITAPAAIGIGLAAIAVGAALSGIAKAGPSLGKGAIGGGSSRGASANIPASAPNIQPQKQVIELKFLPVDLRADGPSLRSVLALDSYRLMRSS